MQRLENLNFCETIFFWLNTDFEEKDFYRSQDLPLSKTQQKVMLKWSFLAKYGDVAALLCNSAKCHAADKTKLFQLSMKFVPYWWKAENPPQTTERRLSIQFAIKHAYSGCFWSSPWQKLQLQTLSLSSSDSWNATKSGLQAETFAQCVSHLIWNYVP